MPVASVPSGSHGGVAPGPPGMRRRLACRAIMPPIATMLRRGPEAGRLQRPNFHSESHCARITHLVEYLHEQVSAGGRRSSRTQGEVANGQQPGSNVTGAFPTSWAVNDAAAMATARGGRSSGSGAAIPAWTPQGCSILPAACLPAIRGQVLPGRSIEAVGR